MLSHFTSECECSSDGSNSDACSDCGVCHCLDRFQGDQCTECSDGYFGSNCSRKIFTNNTEDGRRMRTFCLHLQYRNFSHSPADVCISSSSEIIKSNFDQIKSTIKEFHFQFKYFESGQVRSSQVKLSSNCLIRKISY